MLVLCCAVQVRAADMGHRGGTKIDSSILRQVEHADLINYGLIPEFVGRLPVIVSLQVGRRGVARVCAKGTRHATCGSVRFCWRVVCVMVVENHVQHLWPGNFHDGILPLAGHPGTDHVHVSSFPSPAHHLQELSEDELVQVLTGPKNALTKQYKKLFDLNQAAFGVTQGALRAIARKAIDKGTGTRSLRSIMENLLTEAMYHVPEEGPAAAKTGRPIGVLLDEQAVLEGSGGRIMPADQLEQVLAADAASSDGGLSDGGSHEPIAAEVH